MLRILRRILDLPATRRLDAAAGGRRWQGAPTFGWINAEIAAGASRVRQRGTYSARNNPWLANGVSAIVANAIGAGIMPQPQHPDPATRAELSRLWNAWTHDADADGVLDHYGQQALAVRTLVEQGECFAHLVPTAAGLKVRLFDPEMVPADDTRELADGRRIIQGVELDAAGRRVAYHVRRARPDVPTLNAGRSALDTVRLPAEDIAHLFVPLAPGQVRGLSWTAPVLLRLHELDLYEDAQLVRQKVAALFTGFIMDPTGSAAGFEGTPVNGVLESGLEPGTLKVLPPGFDIKFSDPAEVGDGAVFVKTQLRAVAAGLGVPEHLLTGDMSQANYSSLRAGLVEFRARLEQLQYSVVIHQFCRPIWRAWIMNELLAGRIAGELDDLLAVEWITPRQPWVDPQKDAQAVELALRLGLMSRQQAVAELGWNVERLDAEIAADRARERELGLSFGAPGTKDVADADA